MRVIRVLDGQVQEVAETGVDEEGAAVTLEQWRERFHPDIGEWHAHETAQAGWSFDGQDAAPPSPPTVGTVATSKGEALRRATEQSIVSGFVSNVLGSGYTYPTDRDTQIEVAGEFAAAKHDPDLGPFHVWCAPASDPGDWARRGHSDNQMISLGLAYRQHVKDRKAQGATLRGQVIAIVTDYEAGNITADAARAQINAIEWTEPGA